MEHIDNLFNQIKDLANENHQDSEVINEAYNKINIYCSSKARAFANSEL